MKYRHLYSIILSFLLLTSALLGCGGDSTSVSTQSNATFDLGKYSSLTAGTTYTLTFMGTDTTGATYTGSEQCTVVGATTYDGKNVIQKNHVLSLTKTGVGVITAGTVKQYYNADRTLYKEVYSSGFVNTSTNIFELPSAVQPGNFAGQSMSSSDGTTSAENWQISDIGNNIASIAITTTENQNISGVDTFTVTKTGTMLSMKQVVYDFPSAGVIMTLNGVMN